MKFLQILALMLLLTTLGIAQECGYTFLTIYLTNSKGQSIKNAEVKTFGKDFKNEDSLHYPTNQVSYDRLRKNIAWSEEKGAYFGSEGMCGGHRDVGLRISAKGFETFDKIIDLPLGWTSYSIKLKQKGTNELAEALNLSHFFGKVLDENEALITGADFELVDGNGKKNAARSDSNGQFEIDLRIENYTVKVSKPGFRKLKIINLQIEDAKMIYLDLTLKVRGCDDCDGDILGENNGENRKEIVIDYKTIKRKNNNY